MRSVAPNGLNRRRTSACVTARNTRPAFANKRSPACHTSHDCAVKHSTPLQTRNRLFCGTSHRTRQIGVGYLLAPPRETHALLLQTKDRLPATHRTTARKLGLLLQTKKRTFCRTSHSPRGNGRTALRLHNLSLVELLSPCWVWNVSEPHRLHQQPARRTSQIGVGHLLALPCQMYNFPLITLLYTCNILVSNVLKQIFTHFYKFFHRPDPLSRPFTSRKCRFAPQKQKQ